MPGPRPPRHGRTVEPQPTAPYGQGDTAATLVAILGTPGGCWRVKSDSTRLSDSVTSSPTPSASSLSIPLGEPPPSSRSPNPPTKNEPSLQANLTPPAS